MMSAEAPGGKSFKAQLLQAREEAIIDTVTRLLADKGFEAMTVGEVATAVGIAKASLYKHFPSKEDLAAAAMVRAMRRALAFMDELDPGLAPMDGLRAVMRWAMALQLAGEMPVLPGHASLRAALMANQVYAEARERINQRLGAWIEAAQREGALSTRLPPDAVLYTLYARTGDPVLTALKAAGPYSDEEIIELVLTICFDGLAAR